MTAKQRGWCYRNQSLQMLPTREHTAAEQTTSLMKLRAASLDLEVNALSGGNQQKVAIAKWL
jgi:ABC-type sugar transport system ATPase subunit